MPINLLTFNNLKERSFPLFHTGKLPPQVAKKNLLSKHISGKHLRILILKTNQSWKMNLKLPDRSTN